MRKIKTWQWVLNQYITECTGKPYQWGVFDCATFAADWVHKATGVDMLADWRGKYTNDEDSEALIQSKNYDDFYHAVCAAFEQYGIEPVRGGTQAKKGDVVLYGAALGICVGEFMAHINIEKGLTFLRKRDDHVVWSLA